MNEYDYDYHDLAENADYVEDDECYYDDGTVLWICHYKNDNREGKCTDYFSDGRIAGTEMYKNDKLVGVKHCTDGRIGSEDLDCTER